MREIEYRCWYDNHMHRVVDIDFSYNKINLFAADIINFDEGILMQYTNLKDKNNIKIFEGDIVKVSYKGVTDIGVIIYEYNGFTIDVSHLNRPYGRVDFIAKYVEVIGNLYANPELLYKEV